MARWDCHCGATGLAGPFCAWCGRRNPGVAPPPGPPPAPERAPVADGPAEAFAGPAAAGPVAAAPFAPADLAGWNVATQPPRVGLTPVTRVIGTLLTALLVLGGVTVARRTPEPAGGTVAAPSSSPSSPLSSSPSESPSPSPSPSRSATVRSPDLDTAVARAKAFIEEFRGRPFKKDVDVRLLAGAAFERALTEGEDGDMDDPFLATLRGLQLIDPGDDLEETEESLVDGVVGFYDDDAERLVVRAGRLDPYAELTLVHELAHAWQDQHFDLSSLWKGVSSDDEALAVRSLIEGDAQRTEAAWREAQPEAVRDEIDRLEERFDDEPGGPDGEPSKATTTLSAFYGFPYQVGETFADELADADALDRAFAKPPVSTAQVLHPEKYLAGDLPENPVDPVRRGRVVDRGTLGEAGLIVAATRGEFGPEILELAEAWDGDEFVTYVTGGRTCTSVSLHVDPASKRADLVALLKKNGFDDVATNGANGVTFGSCEKRG